MCMGIVRRGMTALLVSAIVGAVWIGASWNDAQGRTSDASEAASVLNALPRLPTVTRNEMDKDIAALVRKVEQSGARMRGDYCALLASAGERGAKGLVYLLANGDANARWEAVFALGRSKSPLAATAIRAALRDASWGVRSEAALVLGKAGTDEDVPILRAVAASDPNGSVRKAALRGLEALRQRALTGKAPKDSLESATDTRPPADRPAVPAQMDAPTRTPPVEALPSRAEMSPPNAAETDLPEPSAPASVASVEQMTPGEIDRPGTGSMEGALRRPDARMEGRRMRPPARAEVSLFPASPMSSPARPLRAVPAEEVRRAAREVDRFVAQKIRDMGLDASPKASDGIFLRRVWLDLTGAIPPATEAAGFVLTGGADKRRATIDSLVESEAYRDHWADVWMEWLVGTANPDSPEVIRLRAWLRDALDRNVPYDAMARALLTTTGPSHEDGAAGYLLRYDVNPVELAARTSRMFLGLPLQCAQCHDHKTEPWKQTDFYGVAAFFAATEREEVYETVQENGRERRRAIGAYLRDRPPRDVAIPDTNVRVSATFLTGAPYRPTGRETLREAYANWMTEPTNPYFAKAIVNRMWAYFMGRGFVEPIDGFGVLHTPTHPALLDWLADDFVAHRYNLRYLTRVILNTEAYQRSAKRTPRNRYDDRYLTHARVRPLTAEQLFYSLLEATNIESRQRRRQADVEAMKRDYLRRFRFVFGNDEMSEEELDKPTISQALMMMNGSIVNEGSLSREGTRLARILETRIGTQKRMEAIYLATLSRLPTPRERSYFRFYLESSSYRDRNKAFEDLYWGLLNSAEFASNH